MSSPDFAPHSSDSTYLIEAGVGVIIQSLFYGIFIVLILFSTRSLLLKGFGSRVNVAMLATTLCMFATSSAVWALSLVRFIMIIKTVDSSDPMISPEQVVYANQAAEHMGVITEVVSSINPMLSDAVVIWRACVLWQGNKPAFTVVLCSLLGGAIVSFLIFAGCAANEFNTNQVLCRDVQYIGLGLILSTNIVATSSIAFTAWRHRRFIMANLGHKSKKSHAENILVLLIESGMLYCLICVTPILFIFIQLPTEVYMIQWTWPIMTHIAGIYPTVILLLVAFKRTIWDSLSEFDNQVTLPDIQFRSAPDDVEETGTHHQLSDPRQIYPSVAGQVVAKEADKRLSATPSISESAVIWHPPGL